MIKTSEAIDQLADALAGAQAEMKAAEKSGENKFDRYTYARLEDYLAVARPILAKHGLSVVMAAGDLRSLPDRTTKQGALEHAVNITVYGRLIHRSGQWIEVTGVGEGQDRSDKAPYKAITGGKKYLLASLLAIPTTDEAEEDTEPAAESSGEPNWLVKCRAMAPELRHLKGAAIVDEIRARCGEDYKRAAAEMEKAIADAKAKKPT